MESGEADLTWATGATLSLQMLLSQVTQKCLSNCSYINILGWNEGEEDKIKIHENDPQRDWISEQQAQAKDGETEIDE